MTGEKAEEIYGKIGLKVRATRRDRGYSQQQLCGMIQYSQPSLKNLEMGKQRTPLHIIYDIANALDADIFDIIPSN